MLNTFRGKHLASAGLGRRIVRTCVSSLSPPFARCGREIACTTRSRAFDVDRHATAPAPLSFSWATSTASRTRCCTASSAAR
eukprot:6184102-Pleurochrysis_carterae.AAC.2